MEDTKLTTTVTVKQYREFKKSGDQEKIANLIYERFFERYIEPFEDNKSKHGFSMMAVSCLMIETLYCFQNGQKRTVGPGGDVFEKFFSDSIHLKEFVGFGREFYSKIRCAEKSRRAWFPCPCLWSPGSCRAIPAEPASRPRSTGLSP